MSIRPITPVPNSTDALSGATSLDPPPEGPPGFEELAGHLIGWLRWGVLAAGTASGAGAL